MDVVRQSLQIVKETFQKFTTNFVSGYLAGSVWGWLRPTGVDRGLIWGLDFGILSAIFSATNSVTQLVVAAWPTKAASGEKDEKNASSAKLQQQASLWSVVVRNMILALYFTRNGGYAKMARFACMYGGMTYYFVSQKAKRMAKMFPNGMMGSGGMGGMNGMGGGMGGMSGMGGMGGQQQPSAAAMQQLMQQFAAMQQTQMRTPSQPPSTEASGGPSSTKNVTPPPSSPKKKQQKPKEEDVLDVEWEIED